MGRVSKAQAAQHREHVVRTAARLFRARGVENVSIADVMAEAGLTPGGFYKQFASKEALIDEAFALAFEQSSRSWTDATGDSTGGPGQGLRALIEHYFADRPAERNCPILSFSSAVSQLPGPSPAGQTYATGTEELFRQFQQTASAPDGEVGPEEMPRDQTLVLFAAMLGTGLMVKAMGRTPLVSEMQAAVLDALPNPSKDAK
ncbi:TetR/AcrR family transcriptional regulator [Microbacterium sp. A93]|uniref:TetR/AcrR family transcriptional regulator n=1 Tax=Microbacterium sp. A93 TaxID=3450716 RepID=UPI003F432A3B